VRRFFSSLSTRYWINGHSFIAVELQHQGVRFHKDDNAFLSVSDPQALQPQPIASVPTSSARAWIMGRWS